MVEYYRLPRIKYVFDRPYYAQEAMDVNMADSVHVRSRTAPLVAARKTEKWVVSGETSLYAQIRNAAGLPGKGNA
jgi:hypothetical protein